jgi:Rrf2 family protein
MSAMRLSARAEYAVHALVELAAAGQNLVPTEQLAQEQAIPGTVLEAVMTQLRRAELVVKQPGPDGGFSLARQATEISLAEVVNVLSVL